VSQTRFPFLHLLWVSTKAYGEAMIFIIFTEGSCKIHDTCASLIPVRIPLPNTAYRSKHVVLVKSHFYAFLGLLYRVDAMSVAHEILSCLSICFHLLSRQTLAHETMILGALNIIIRLWSANPFLQQSPKQKEHKRTAIHMISLELYLFSSDCYQHLASSEGF
jgi:hypothetical protein